MKKLKRFLCHFNLHTWGYYVGNEIHRFCLDCEKEQIRVAIPTPSGRKGIWVNAGP